MKRIAIIGNAFGGSTTSLIEAFLKQEYVVDFYRNILFLTHIVLLLVTLVVTHTLKCMLILFLSYITYSYKKM